MMMQAGTKLDPINKAAPLKSTPSAHGKKVTKSSVPMLNSNWTLPTAIPNSKHSCSKRILSKTRQSYSTTWTQRPPSVKPKRAFLSILCSLLLSNLLWIRLPMISTLDQHPGYVTSHLHQPQARLGWAGLS